MLRLFGRCKSFNTLPFYGGILQQPIWVMESLDVIQAAIDKVKARREDDAKTASMKASMMGRLDG